MPDSDQNNFKKKYLLDLFNVKIRFSESIFFQKGVFLIFLF